MDFIRTKPFRALFVGALCAVRTVHGGPVFRGLGDLPGGYFESEAYDVSSDGSVVVGLGSSAAGFQPVRWTPDGGLEALVEQPSGGWRIRASGVSANGTVIVGQNMIGAFRWTQAGGTARLSDQYDVATAVSADGSVVVGGVFPSFSWQAFRWTQSDGMVELGTLPGGVSSNAEAVSGDGSTVVGGAANASNYPEAFRWTQSEGMVGLGHLLGGDDQYSWAFSTSGDGSVVVGHSRSDAGLEAFRWTEELGLLGLGDLPGGEFESTAYAVSADGSVVVGAGYPDSVWGAFIWNESIGMRNIQDVLVNDFGADLDGWTLAVAHGISDDGMVVVGYGFNPDGNREAWIATIPDPATVTLVGLGSLLLLRRRIVP